MKHKRKENIHIENSIQKGIQFIKQGMFYKALAIFKEMLHTHPNEPRILYNTAVICDAIGQKNKTWSLLSRCIEIDPAFPYAHYYTGKLHLQNNSYERAYEAFRKTIAQDIEFSSAYDGIQKALSAMGKSISADPADIVFYTGGLSFHGKTLDEKGLGGSESALIYLARAFAANGMNVHVYCNCEQPGNYNGVMYDNLIDFHIYRKLHTFPVLISSRSLLPFKIDLKASKRILWIHDNTNVAFLENEEPSKLPIDRIFAISQWQKNEWSRYFGIPKDRFFLTRNGVDLSLFKPGKKRHRNRLIYFSRPNRGLNILLDLFPGIRKQVPEAELHIFNYHVPEDHKIESKLRQVKTPGLINRGSLSKTKLATEIAQARLMVYPSTFLETSCIAALEAQSVGTPVVASTLAALPETILDGISGRLIPGDPHSHTFKQDFINTVVSLLKNDDEWKKLSNGAMNRAKKFYDWNNIAKEWISELKK